VYRRLLGSDPLGREVAVPRIWASPQRVPRRASGALRQGERPSPNLRFVPNQSRISEYKVALRRVMPVSVGDLERSRWERRTLGLG